MTVRNLRFLFEPASVAVVGASNRPRSVGWAVMRNLLAGGFEGPIMPVNPRRQAVAGVLAYPDVASLPVATGRTVFRGWYESLDPGLCPIGSHPAMEIGRVEIRYDAELVSE